jgi:hypothetical protein
VHQVVGNRAVGGKAEVDERQDRQRPDAEGRKPDIEADAHKRNHQGGETLEPADPQQIQAEIGEGRKRRHDGFRLVHCFIPYVTLPVPKKPRSPPESPVFASQCFICPEYSALIGPLAALADRSPRFPPLLVFSQPAKDLSETIRFS